MNKIPRKDAIHDKLICANPKGEALKICENPCNLWLKNQRSLDNK